MSEVPVGVKVIAILEYIGAAFSILGGIMMLFGAGFAASIFSAIPGGELFANLGTALFVAGGVAFIIFGAIGIILGKGLWEAKNWARITVIVLTSISILFGVLSLFGGQFGNIIGLAVSIFIVVYLGFSKEVKSAFA